MASNIVSFHQRVQGCGQAAYTPRRAGQGNRPGPSTAPTLRFRECCTARSFAAPTPTPGFAQSTPQKRRHTPTSRAVITSKDLPVPDNSKANVSGNILARDKVLYKGHAVAAVAAPEPARRRRGTIPYRSGIRGTPFGYRRGAGHKARGPTAARQARRQHRKTTPS